MAAIILTHWAASSLVGVMMSALVAAAEAAALLFRPLEDATLPPPRCIIRSMMGRRKAAVLPLPVTAEAQTSRPDRATGMTDPWMGVGVTNPMEATPRSSGRDRLSCAKVVMALAEVASWTASKYAEALAASSLASSSSSSSSSLELSSASSSLPDSSELSSSSLTTFFFFLPPFLILSSLVLSLSISPSMFMSASSTSSSESESSLSLSEDSPLPSSSSSLPEPLPDADSSSSLPLTSSSSFVVSSCFFMLLLTAATILATAIRSGFFIPDVSFFSRSCRADLYDQALPPAVPDAVRDPMPPPPSKPSPSSPRRPPNSKD
mmetsp:Transcript_10312/g.28990  ORF Transcript_10312/g.28990 Transcript_10312/m.28990 type:complete len:321 (-) Transcript_10312:118-1080(-)